MVMWHRVRDIAAGRDGRQVPNPFGFPVSLVGSYSFSFIITKLSQGRDSSINCPTGRATRETQGKKREALEYEWAKYALLLLTKEALLV